MVFQDPGLFPWRTALENVEFGLELQGVPAAARRERARALLEPVGLRGFEARYPRELSGGMKQRVAIARALALDAPILLMDEPFGALDEQTRLLMGEWLLGIWARTRKTVVFVTHSLQEAILLSQRVVVMTARPGRIKASFEVALPSPRDLDTPPGGRPPARALGRDPRRVAARRWTAARETDRRSRVWASSPGSWCSGRSGRRGATPCSTSRPRASCRPSVPRAPAGGVSDAARALRADGARGARRLSPGRRPRSRARLRPRAAAPRRRDLRAAPRGALRDPERGVVPVADALLRPRAGLEDRVRRAARVLPRGAGGPRRHPLGGPRISFSSRGASGPGPGRASSR